MVNKTFTFAALFFTKMKKSNLLWLISFSFLVLLTINSCDGDATVPKRLKKIWSKLDYRNYRKKAKQDTTFTAADTSNLFDSPTYDPAADTAAQLLAKVETTLEQDSTQIVNAGHKDTALLNKPTNESFDSTIVVRKDSSSKDVKNMDSSELLALKYNLEKVKSNASNDTAKSSCKREKCKVWVKISKKEQRMYVHLDGEVVDTFKVSTGDKQHETPLFDTRVDGRMFKKYSSKKYPGGSYQGLGNMPYVVFIRGGFAMHGTTVGNIKRLGTKASHGCVRLHPNNAKILFELVQNVGPENVWVTITNS